MCRKTTLASVALALTALTCTGCDPLKIKEATETLTAQLDESTRRFVWAVASAAQQSEAWRTELKLIADQYEIVADRFPGEAGTEARYFVDFAIQRIKDNSAQAVTIQNLIEKRDFLGALREFRKLRENNPLGRPPEIGRSSPSRLAMVKRAPGEVEKINAETVVKFYGHNFVFKNEKKFRVQIRDASDKPVRDITDRFSIHTPYLAHLDVSGESGPEFKPSDRRIMVSYDGRLICQVPITWRRTPPAPPRINKFVFTINTGPKDIEKKETCNLLLLMNGVQVAKLAGVGHGEKWEGDNDKYPSTKVLEIPCDLEYRPNSEFEFQISVNGHKVSWDAHVVVSAVIDKIGTKTETTEQFEFHDQNELKRSYKYAKKDAKVYKHKWTW